MRIDGTDDPNSWEKIYQTNDAGWDIGKPAPPFASLLEDKPTWLTNGSMAAFGAGLGHDAAYFAKNGFEVTAIDFAPSAVEGIKSYSKNLENLTPLLGDILNLPGDLESCFDYVLEHTCFCAIPPKNRVKYVESVTKVLKPGGILFGLFYRFDPTDDKGPPHATSEEEVKELFEKDFEILEWETPNNSHGRRKNRERFIAFKAKK